MSDLTHRCTLPGCRNEIPVIEVFCESCLSHLGDEEREQLNVLRRDHPDSTRLIVATRLAISHILDGKGRA